MRFYYLCNMRKQERIRFITSAMRLPLANWAHFWHEQDLTAFIDKPLGSLPPLKMVALPENIEILKPLFSPKDFNKIKISKRLFDVFKLIEGQMPEELRDRSQLSTLGNIQYFKARLELAKFEGNASKTRNFERSLKEAENKVKNKKEKGKGADILKQIADTSLILKTNIPLDSTSTAIFWRMQVMAIKTMEGQKTD